MDFDLVDFFHNQSRLIGVDSMKFTAGDVGAMADELRSGFETGSLKSLPIETIPFENAVMAYEKIAAGQGGSKQALTFS